MLTKFVQDRRGNFALNVALMALPVLATIGASVDYAKLSREVSKMQDAADSAALAAALEGGPRRPELVKAAKAMFNSNLEPQVRDHVRKTKLKVHRTDAGYSYEFQVRYKYPTSFLHLAGFKNLKGDVSATSGAAYGNMEIALVIDSTGSMGRDNKMPELKKALDGFFDRFQPMRDNVKFSIVPFDTQVRLERVRFVDPSLNSTGNPYSLDTDCSTLGGDERDQCVEYQLQCSAPPVDDDDDDDDVPVLPPICDNTAKTSKDNDTITANSDLLGVGRLEWTGCVVDRQQPHDTTSAPVTSDATGYPPAYCASSSLQPILPLTNRFNKLRKRVRDLQPSGNTNLTIGMQWGMETLTEPAPFSETDSHSTQPLRRIMILLTDGNNTQNRWTTKTDKIDERAILACENVKDLVEEFYTIRVISGNEALLRECASTPEHFYSISKASDMTVVFDEIARRVANVRLIN